MAFSGCLLFKGTPVVKQVGDKPRVHVAFTLCRSGGAEDMCPDASEGPGTGPHRILVGLRVPRGTRAPERFAPKAIDSQSFEGPLTFTKELSYTAELNAKAPRSKSFRYFGYASDQAVEDIGADDRARFKIPLRVPKRLVGKRFGVGPLVGVYWVNEEQPIDAPVVCAEDPYDGFTGSDPGGTGTWKCIDYPAEGEFPNVGVRIKKRR